MPIFKTKQSARIHALRMLAFFAGQPIANFQAPASVPIRAARWDDDPKNANPVEPLTRRQSFEARRREYQARDKAMLARIAQAMDERLRPR